LEDIAADRLPDVVLVKKVYAEKALRNRRRKWRLKHVDGLHSGGSQSDNEYMDFLEDLEEDPELRQNVNVYIDRNKIAVDENDSSSECGDIPKISLAEMLDELTIASQDVENTGGAGSTSEMN